MPAIISMSLTSSAASAHYLRSRMSRVCVAITGDTPEEMLSRADAVVRENAFIEFRLDYLGHPLAAIPELREFLYERSEVTAVATCRRTAGGGKFKGSPSAQVEVLTQAAAAGFHLVDLEIETAETLSKAQFSDFRAALSARGTGFILSSHDFEATRDLDKTLIRLQAYQPEFLKIVSTAKSLSDNIDMMRFLGRKSEGANLIGICMGDQGLISRVLGIRAGSIFTFASASEGEETGPGQIAARTLLETYRIDHVETSTRVYGVAGNPIRHSLSPLMLNTAFRRETVNALCVALETRKLSDLLNLVRELPVHGLAVTMPLKQEILQHLEKTDALSAKIGACNTVVRSQDGRLFGFNTDVGGILRPLERRMPLRGARVLVLGAGGAARAAVFGLADKGAEVSILNRTPEVAQKLARQAKAKVIRRDHLAKTPFDIIVNATPAGMSGQKLTHILEPHEINARIVFDTVYNPIDTPLIRTAREKGLAVITGVEMFVQQGARQFEIWTGKPAPEEEMMRVVLHALRRRPENAAVPMKAAASVTTANGAAVKPAPAMTGPEKTARHPEAPKVPSAPTRVTSSARIPVVLKLTKAPASGTLQRSPVARKAVASPAPPSKKKNLERAAGKHTNGKVAKRSSVQATHSNGTRPGTTKTSKSAKKPALSKSPQKRKR